MIPEQKEHSANEILSQEEKSKKGNLFDVFFSQEAAIRALPFFFFLAGIAMVYISNRHYAEKNVREIDKLSKELRELRSEYMTTKAELMYRSNQTEVAKRLEHTGIKEAKVPPKKIVVGSAQ